MAWLVFLLRLNIIVLTHQLSAHAMKKLEGTLVNSVIIIKIQR